MSKPDPILVIKHTEDAAALRIAEARKTSERQLEAVQARGAQEFGQVEQTMADEVKKIEAEADKKFQIAKAQLDQDTAQAIEKIEKLPPEKLKRAVELVVERIMNVNNS